MFKEKAESNLGKMSDLNTIIGKGTSFEGNLNVNSSIRVDGRIKGSVISSDAVIVGKEGQIEGDIQAKSVVIGGKVQGKVVASGKVTLEASSQLKGEIRTSKLVINEGAVFNGNCQMTGGGAGLSLQADRTGNQKSKEEAERVTLGKKEGIS